MKAVKPWEKPKSRKKKKKPGKAGPLDVSKRYSLPRWVVEEIKKVAPEYRSQGRVLQVGMELLVRAESLPAPDPDPVEKTRMTYRIPRRTANIIEDLAKTSYNDDRAQVFSACVKAIKSKKIK